MTKIRWRWVASRAFLILFLTPFVSLLLPAGSEFDQRKLDCIVAKIERLEAACDDPELKDVLNYTARRYNRIERGGVAIHPMRFCAGVNIPWCPGVTIDAECWGYCVNTVLVILVHEAMHDYWPYFGHGHITELERKLERIVWEAQ